MKFRIFSFLVAAAFIGGCASNGSAGSFNSPKGALPPVTQGDATASHTANAYTIVPLQTLGGNSVAATINQIAWISGSSNLPGNQYTQAALWRNNQTIPLGTLGGPNSAIAWPDHNNFGLLAGISETGSVDALGEDWSCQAFFPTVPDTKHVCLGFAWRNGKMVALPTLGGINGYAAGTNDWGQIAGWAETPVHDPTCTAVTKTPGSFYQVLQFEPVFWGPFGHIHRLRALHGDPDGAATAVNDAGDVVGITGTCDQAVGRFTAKHAVLWHDGFPIDLGNFDGGIAWNTPQDVNNRGQVVGFLNLPNDAQGQFQPIGFIWNPGRGLTKILPLPQDTISQAIGINDCGQVVGQSFDFATNDFRAFIWKNGKTVDLNGLIPADSPYFLLTANGIDDRGDIVGQAAVKATGAAIAFVAIPARRWDPFASSTVVRRAEPFSVAKSVQLQLLRRFGLRALPPQ